MSGRPSVFGWHVAHFKDPKQMVRETVMPNFGFGSKEAQALAMLVMSWKHTNLPMAYLPGVHIPEPQRTPEEIAKEQQMLTGEGAFFVKKTCFICHDVSSLGIESATKIGPDLAMALSDVQSRFGRTLEDFLKAPPFFVSYEDSFRAVLKADLLAVAGPGDRAILAHRLSATSQHEGKKQPQALETARNAPLNEASSLPARSPFRYS